MSKIAGSGRIFFPVFVLAVLSVFVLAVLVAFWFMPNGDRIPIFTLILFQGLNGSRDKLLVNNLLPVSPTKLAVEGFVAVFEKIVLFHVLLMFLYATSPAVEDFMHITGYGFDLSYPNLVLLSWHFALSIGILSVGLVTYRIIERGIGLGIIVLIFVQLFDGIFQHFGFPTLLLLALLPIQAWIYLRLDRHYATETRLSNLFGIKTEQKMVIKSSQPAQSTAPQSPGVKSSSRKKLIRSRRPGQSTSPLWTCVKSSLRLAYSSMAIGMLVSILPLLVNYLELVLGIGRIYTVVDWGSTLYLTATGGSLFLFFPASQHNKNRYDYSQRVFPLRPFHGGMAWLILFFGYFASIMILEMIIVLVSFEESFQLFCTILFVFSAVILQTWILGIRKGYGQRYSLIPRLLGLVVLLYLSNLAMEKYQIELTFDLTFKLVFTIAATVFLAWRVRAYLETARHSASIPLSEYHFEASSQATT